MASNSRTFDGELYRSFFKAVEGGIQFQSENTYQLNQQLLRPSAHELDLMKHNR